MSDGAMTFREAHDHAQAFLGKIVRPFQKLEDVLATAQRAENFLASTDAERTAVKAKIEADLQHHADEMARMTQERADFRAAMTEERTALQTDVDRLKIILASLRHEMEVGTKERDAMRRELAGLRRRFDVPA